ncbi:MAG: toxin-antitoxin system YwqK family antitoxin [Bacteroidota bacterium]|nr:toxin-antitoxin system YwqK family antitoxin [Bacteroidota bacterium]
MVRYLLPLLLICIGLSSCGTAPTVVVVDPDLGYQTTFSVTKRDSTFHGPYEKLDQNKALLERGNYIVGRLNGIRELFYPTGKVKVRERYKDGQITDLYEYFHPNGNVELKGYYINGEMYGVWRKYLEDGSLLDEVLMSKNEEMGPFTEYYKDGKIQAEGTYLHGPNEDGVLKLYDESGALYKTMWCDSGRCHTTWEKK